MSKKPTLGFIGQGWIGKHYADHFEERGFVVTRYARGKEYVGNKEKIGECDIVFIAVPTPTTQAGFDYSVVKEVIGLVGEGKTAVIKSTLLPGTTEKLQDEYEKVIVLHSPEFLTESTAKADVEKPFHNIVGIPLDTKEQRAAAERVMSILPEVKSHITCSAREAELFKYLRNCFFFTKTVYMNIFYDIVHSMENDWGVLESLMREDPWIGNQHITPIHKSGRGAGGHCLIKDFAALRQYVEENLPHEKNSINILRSLEEKNKSLLRDSGKDIDLLEGVCGSE